MRERQLRQAHVRAVSTLALVHLHSKTHVLHMCVPKRLSSHQSGLSLCMLVSLIVVSIVTDQAYVEAAPITPPVYVKKVSAIW